MRLTFTLIAEGTSDRVLIPILEWMLLQQHSGHEWTGYLAELQSLPQPPRGLADRIAVASVLFPSDVIFVHRDADREEPEKRTEEIAKAIETIQENRPKCWIPVIPVRMTEAWLLVSEGALRAAVGNPNGRTPLYLPPLHDLEDVPNPKETLKDLLLEASELSGRRKKKFNFPAHRSRVPDSLEDWGVLLQVPSAKALYDHIGRLDFK